MPRFNQEHNSRSRKRKRSPPRFSQANGDTLDTSKPTALFKPSAPRTHTLSVALPGSIISNAQSHDAKTNLAGTLARALSVFCVDEVIVYDDTLSSRSPRSSTFSNKSNLSNSSFLASSLPEPGAYSAHTHPAHFLAHLLSYLECPPYLRKHLFDLHPDLKTAGSLPSLDLPHHLRSGERLPYREGVALPDTESKVEGKSKSKKKKKDKKKGNDAASADAAAEDALQEQEYVYPVDAGLSTPMEVSLPLHLTAPTRLTLKLPPSLSEPSQPPFPQSPHPSHPHTHPSRHIKFSEASSTDGDDPFSQKPIQLSAVAPSTPREESGFYWGFSVRVASSLSAVFEEAPFSGGYDFSIGTSERGIELGEVMRVWREENKKKRGEGKKRNRENESTVDGEVGKGEDGDDEDENGGSDTSAKSDDKLANYQPAQSTNSKPQPKSKPESEDASKPNSDSDPSSLPSKIHALSSYTHLLLVFGGLAGLEAAVRNDETLRKAGVIEAKDVFDLWVDLVLGQGSRTIRTEEAVWIGLMGLKEVNEGRRNRRG